MTGRCRSCSSRRRRTSPALPSARATASSTAMSWWPTTMTASPFVQWFAALEDFIPEDPTIERTIENAGMGCMIIHEIASPLIEIAEDGMSAQGAFDGNGQITEVYPDETTTKVMFERYNCDFLKEDGREAAEDVYCHRYLPDPRRHRRAGQQGEPGGRHEVRAAGRPGGGPETTIILNHPMLAYTDVLGQPVWPYYPEFLQDLC